MVIVLTLPGSAGVIDTFVRNYDRAHGRVMGECSYSQLVQRGVAPRAAYAFADRDRMSEPQRRLAYLIWQRLEAAGLPLFNHPMRQMGRYELLRTLFDRRINDFNVYRMSEPLDELRFPAFLRVENDHAGPRTDLLQDRASLEAAAKNLVMGGFPRNKLLATEFSETSDGSGFYRKYGAVRIGDRVYGQHLMLCSSWLGKRDTWIRNEATTAASNDYFFQNPHADLVRPIFELANVDYGRIDYSMKGDRIQVWEINDNPMFTSFNPQRLGHPQKRITYVESMAALSEGVEPGPPVELHIELEEVLAAVGEAVAPA